MIFSVGLSPLPVFNKPMLTKLKYISPAGSRGRVSNTCTNLSILSYSKHCISVFTLYLLHISYLFSCYFSTFLILYVKFYELNVSLWNIQNIRPYCMLLNIVRFPKCLLGCRNIKHSISLWLNQAVIGSKCQGKVKYI